MASMNQSIEIVLIVTTIYNFIITWGAHVQRQVGVFNGLLQQHKVRLGSTVRTTYRYALHTREKGKMCLVASSSKPFTKDFVETYQTTKIVSNRNPGK